MTAAISHLRLATQSSLQVLSFGITVIKETVGLDGLVVGTAGKGLGAEEW